MIESSDVFLFWFIVINSKRVLLSSLALTKWIHFSTTNTRQYHFHASIFHSHNSQTKSIHRSFDYSVYLEALPNMYSDNHIVPMVPAILSPWSILRLLIVNDTLHRFNSNNLLFLQSPHVLNSIHNDAVLCPQVRY